MSLLLQNILPQLSNNCVVSRLLYNVLLLLPANKYIYFMEIHLFHAVIWFFFLYFSLLTKLPTEGTQWKKEIRQSLEVCEGFGLVFQMAEILQHPPKGITAPKFLAAASGGIQLPPNLWLLSSLQNTPLKPWFAAITMIAPRTLPQGCWILPKHFLTSQSPKSSAEEPRDCCPLRQRISGTEQCRDCQQTTGRQRK